jgi:hypothetical protein
MRSILSCIALSLFVFLGSVVSGQSETTAPAERSQKLAKIYTKKETEEFISTAKETMAALAAKDKKLMIMKLTDLEAAWDGDEDKLKPRNEAQWKFIDETLDRGINSLRSTHYDEVKGRQALDDLLKALEQSTI